ncbi:MAG: hypothetical protein MHM6MM_000757 [Cercozoa sp. M6MM]
MRTRVSVALEGVSARLLDVSIANGSAPFLAELRDRSSPFYKNKLNNDQAFFGAAATAWPTTSVSNHASILTGVPSAEHRVLQPADVPRCDTQLSDVAKSNDTRVVVVTNSYDNNTLAALFKDVEVRRVGAFDATAGWMPPSLGGSSSGEIRRWHDPLRHACDIAQTHAFDADDTRPLWLHVMASCDYYDSKDSTSYEEHRLMPRIYAMDRWLQKLESAGVKTLMGVTTTHGAAERAPRPSHIVDVDQVLQQAWSDATQFEQYSHVHARTINKRSSSNTGTITVPYKIGNRVGTLAFRTVVYPTTSLCSFMCVSFVPDKDADPGLYSTLLSSAMSVLRNTKGIYAVLTPKDAAASFLMPEDVLGDFVVIADADVGLRDTVRAGCVDWGLSQAGGCVDDADGFLAINAPLTKEYKKRLSKGAGARTFNLIDALRNGVIE